MKILASRFCTFLTASFLSVSVHGANLVGWTFDGAHNGVDTSPANNGSSADPMNNPYVPQIVAANVSGSGITAPSAGGAGSTTVRVGALGATDLGSPGYPNGDFFLTSTQGAGDTVGQYFTFTVEPASGYSLDLADMRLLAARGGGSDRGFRVATSLDGYSSFLSPSAGFADPTNMSNANGGSQRFTFTSYRLDLSGAGFDDITSPLTFRFYPWSGAPNNTIEMDNLVLTGTVNAVPEPGSWAIVLTGLACSCGAFRLRK